ncbi:MAG TPA: hypothetical protein VD768_06470, partial [Sphingomicrobium sp.]|nr:hypothetical protein [Sphingomicrobium sp.]
MNARIEERMAVFRIAGGMEGRFPLLAALVVIGACAPSPDMPEARPSPAQEAACPIHTSDWAGWVNAMPGPNASPTLIVTGKATVPTGGFSFAWRDMRAMESHPVQVAVDL